MQQSGDICLYMSFAHAVRLHVASAWVQHCSLYILCAFVFPKRNKNIQIAQKESVIQPHTWKYSSCCPELAVSVWTAGSTCQSLPYDIGLKDLSLAVPSAMCKSWRLWNTSIPLSAGCELWLWNGSFWRAHSERPIQKGCFSTHMLSMDPIHVK